MTSFYLYRKVVTAFSSLMSSLMSRLMSRLIKLYQSLISALHPAAVAAGLLDIQYRVALANSYIFIY
jgi:hypothetical protein